VKGGFGPLFVLAPEVSPLEVTLACHPGARSDAVRGVTARVHRTAAGSLKVAYVLEAELPRLRIPPPSPSRSGEKLWQHTCFEVFIARRMPAYHEFNFSPSREWAAYAFGRYRDGAQLTDDALDPQVTVRTGAHRLELDATVHLERISSLHVTDRLSLALSAVIEDTDGGFSYWTLRHPPGKPDFHHPEAFALELDEVRN
jgi:hypothetical protein